MNISAYKEYRFAYGILTAAKSGKKYKFSIGKDDRFYNYMKKHIVKEKIEGLSSETIDEISIEDTDKTLFNENSFTLNAAMLVTDKNDNVQSYTLAIKNVKLKENQWSEKAYNSGHWRLEMYDLEFQYQTKIDIVEVTD